MAHFGSHPFVSANLLSVSSDWIKFAGQIAVETPKTVEITGRVSLENLASSY